MPIEVEQKFAVDDHRELQPRLLQLGAHEIDRVEQVDRYFNHPSRNFAQTDEALRLRRVGEANLITYKGPKLDAATKMRREIELPLGEELEMPPNMQSCSPHLASGFPARCIKCRRIMHMSWQGKSVEIALDMVTGLGSFVELEISADEHEIEPAKAAIASLAAELKLNRNERRSYLELLLASADSLLTALAPAATVRIPRRRAPALRFLFFCRWRLREFPRTARDRLPPPGGLREWCRR